MTPTDLTTRKHSELNRLYIIWDIWQQTPSLIKSDEDQRIVLYQSHMEKSCVCYSFLSSRHQVHFHLFNVIEIVVFVILCTFGRKLDGEAGAGQLININP